MLGEYYNTSRGMTQVLAGRGNGSLAFALDIYILITRVAHFFDIVSAEQFRHCVVQLCV